MSCHHFQRHHTKISAPLVKIRYTMCSSTAATAASEQYIDKTDNTRGLGRPPHTHPASAHPSALCNCPTPHLQNPTPHHHQDIPQLKPQQQPLPISSAQNNNHPPQPKPSPPPHQYVYNAQFVDPKQNISPNDMGLHLNHLNLNGPSTAAPTPQPLTPVLPPFAVPPTQFQAAIHNNANNNTNTPPQPTHQPPKGYPGSAANHPQIAHNGPPTHAQQPGKPVMPQFGLPPVQFQPTSPHPAAIHNNTNNNTNTPPQPIHQPPKGYPGSAPNHTPIAHNRPSPPGHQPQPIKPVIQAFGIPPGTFLPTSPHPIALQNNSNTSPQPIHPSPQPINQPPKGYPGSTPPAVQLTALDRKVRENQNRLIRKVGGRLSTLLSERLQVQPYFRLLRECRQTRRGISEEYYESLSTLMKVNYLCVSGRRVIEGNITDLEKRISAAYNTNSVTVSIVAHKTDDEPAKLVEIFPSYTEMLEQFYSHAVETEGKLSELRIPRTSAEENTAFVASLGRLKLSTSLHRLKHSA